MSDHHADERRRFQRIPVSLHATLRTAKRQHDCAVADLSLHGVLLDQDGLPAAQNGDKVTVDIQLDQLGEACIHMQGEVAHVENGQLGIKCHQLDLDSATLLRRLVELNLSDPDLLERELAALIDAA